MILSLDVQEFIAQAFLPIAVVSVAAAAATLLGLVLLATLVSTYLSDR